MATAVKQRRGTADEHDTDKGDGSGFTGLEGEITVDTTNDTIRVHDGSQVGGHRLAKYSELSTVASPISPTDAGTDTTMFPLLSADASGTLSAKTDQSSLTYNASSGTLSATAFSGDLTGDVTGNVSGSSGSCTGNSATATTAGQATLATTANAVATSTSGSGDQFVTFVDNDSAGSQTHRVHGEVKYNTSNTTFTVNGTVAATTLTGAYDADQLTGTIDDARIPSGIARDSELTSFITASSSDTLTNKSIDAGQLTGTIDDARIPSGIARDSELSSFITASSTETLTNKTIDASQLSGTIDDARIPSGIARDSELSSFITASSTDTLTNKSISGEQINSGTIPSARIPTLNQDTTGTASKVTVTDSTTDTAFAIPFHDGSNNLLDDTGSFTYNPSSGDFSATTVTGTTVKATQTLRNTGGRNFGFSIDDTSTSNSNSDRSNLFGRINNTNAPAGGSAKQSSIRLPDHQGQGGSSTLLGGFLYGDNLSSGTTLTTTQFASFRGGMLVHYNASGCTADLPISTFSDNNGLETSKARIGDTFRICSALGTLTIDLDGSGTGQSVFKLGNTTNGTASSTTLTTEITFPAGSFGTLTCVFTNIWVLTEHCGTGGS